MEQKNDNVNRPKHYISHPSGVECIDITRHYNFDIGNSIKYLWRCGLKEENGMQIIEKEIEDVRKAIWYEVDHICMQINEIENEEMKRQLKEKTVNTLESLVDKVSRIREGELPTN
jgi:hypothetical protein